MPTFETLNQDEVAELTRRRSTCGGVDLTPYKSAIQGVLEVGWGRVRLATDDNVRATKRRMTLAGKELNRVVKWSRKSTPAELIYQIIGQEEQQRRKRKPRKK